MPTFNPTSFQEKLRKITGLPETIQSLSMFVQLHDVQAVPAIVAAWRAVLLDDSSDATRRLCLLYLCNEILQTSRQKKLELGQAFRKQFEEALPSCFEEMLDSEKIRIDSVVANKISHLLDVWNKRDVLGRTVVTNLLEIVLEKTGLRGKPPQPSASTSASLPPSTSATATATVSETKESASEASPSSLERFKELAVSMDEIRSLFRQSASIHHANVPLLEKEVAYREQLLQDLQDLLNEEADRLAEAVVRCEQAKQQVESELSIEETGFTALQQFLGRSQ